MLKTCLLAAVAILLSFSPAVGEMYKWVDDKGVVTFKDVPPPPSKKRKQVKTYTDDDFAPALPVPPESITPKPVARATAESSSARPAVPRKTPFTGTVELYVTDWCGYCKKAIMYLNDRGIPYVAYNIEKDSAANQRHKELGGRGVPLIIVGSNRMSGFSPDALEYYLENSK